jgi:multidrug resistance efflux pump
MLKVEEPESRRRTTLIVIIQRAIRRPYLFMAAVVLVIGAIWFFRLAVQEFLLIDRLVNVYTNDAQVQMDTYAVRPAVTAEVLEVLVNESTPVQKGDILLRLDQQDFLAQLRQAEAEAEGITRQIYELQEALPLTLEKAQQEVKRAEAMVETKEQAYRRTQVLLSVEREQTDKMVQEHTANIEAARARLQDQESAAREAQMTLERTRSLFADGIVSQDRLDAAQISLDRSQARLAMAREQLREAQMRYPSGESPEMIRVREEEVKRLAAELKEQQTVLDLAHTNLRLANLGEQKLHVLQAKLKEAQAKVDAYSLKLDKTIVRSPIDGIVAYRDIEPGEMVEGDPSNPPVMVLHNPYNRWIAANVWESDISRVQIGDEVEIWIDAFKPYVLGRGKPFKGRVVRINPTTSSEVTGLPPERFFTRRERKVLVGVSLEGEHPGLRAGMLAEVLIHPGGGAVANERKSP